MGSKSFKKMKNSYLWILQERGLTPSEASRPASETTKNNSLPLKVWTVFIKLETIGEGLLTRWPAEKNEAKPTKKPQSL